MLDLFEEFNALIRPLQLLSIRYAVIGGFAVALHGHVRATKDIDFLCHPDDLSAFEQVLKQAGYLRSGLPIPFSSSGMTLHRFFKPQPDSDLLTVIDVLTSQRQDVLGVLDRVVEEPWGEGVVRVANRQDLMWLKNMRSSAQDRADIEALQDRNEHDDQS